MKKMTLFLLLITAFMGCKEEAKKDQELNELFTLMQGSFNSELQSKKDSSYYNISLNMYPIWQDKGNYLYVEQALNSMQNKPYRQRIYKVSRVDDENFISEIYTIPNDSLWIGKWKNPDSFDDLKLESIVEREGCGVVLQRLEKNHYQGATQKYSCMSSLRGANYATSEVEIKQGQIISWDRGFDAEGNHIWGATKGGYIFDKLTN